LGTFGIDPPTLVIKPKRLVAMVRRMLSNVVLFNPRFRRFCRLEERIPPADPEIGG